MHFIKYLLIATFLIFVYKTNAQSYPVERSTGRVIRCSELNCDENDTNYEDLDRICLYCYMRVSDSTMTAEVREITEKLKNKNKDSTRFIKDQKSWQADCIKIATTESDEYKGGAMEMPIFVRRKLILTNARIIFLRNYKMKL